MTAADSVARRQGVLAEWNDDRGYGFITPEPRAARVFVHVSAFPRGRRPRPGAAVTFVEVRDEGNRARAAQVRYATRRPVGSLVSGTPLAVAVAAAFFLLLGSLHRSGDLPLMAIGAYAAFSVVAFAAYGLDKSAAKARRHRTRESTLHAMAIMGGWPGALVARKFFRHKTVKQPFRTVFWFTVIANCAALAWFVNKAPGSLP